MTECTTQAQLDEALAQGAKEVEVRAERYGPVLEVEGDVRIHLHSGILQAAHGAIVFAHGGSRVYVGQDAVAVLTDRAQAVVTFGGFVKATDHSRVAVYDGGSAYMQGSSAGVLSCGATAILDQDASAKVHPDADAYELGRGRAEAVACWTGEEAQE